MRKIHRKSAWVALVAGTLLALYGGCLDATIQRILVAVAI